MGPSAPEKRHERSADEIASLIERGALRPGDRLPSVRQAGMSRKIGPSTVFGVYYLLEARGLIRARPRYGYYVSATVTRDANEPRTSSPKKRSSAVAISELVFQVPGSVKDRTVAPGYLFSVDRRFANFVRVTMAIRRTRGRSPRSGLSASWLPRQCADRAAGSGPVSGQRTVVTASATA
ncbi:MAG: GntR family transcriptional regulator [Burkholderiales bacterium]|nr:GntR family transcriptional regulator [Burkholderiales bacterium]